MSVYLGSCAMVYKQRSEDSLQKPVSSSSWSWGAGAQSQVVTLGCLCLYPLSRLAGPDSVFWMSVGLFLFLSLNIWRDSPVKQSAPGDIFLRLLTIGLTNWADTGLLRLSVSIYINFGSWDILMNFLPYLYNQNPRPWDGTVCVMSFSMYRVSGDDHFILIWVFCVLIDFSLTPSLLT